MQFVRYIGSYEIFSFSSRLGYSLFHPRKNIVLVYGQMNELLKARMRVGLIVLIMAKNDRDMDGMS